MIGQSKILKWVETNKNSFPHFIVIVGDEGSGKRTLIKCISNMIDALYANLSSKVDDVREVISTAYKAKTKIMYCFENADNMRNEAKNAMLKITEEPPENAYFCITVISDSSLLETIKSRAIVLYMQPYTNEELKRYMESKYSSTNKTYKQEILNVATTPHDIDLLVEYKGPFIDYVQLVVDNISEVEPANAFKSSIKLKLKVDGEGYDLGLFWKCFIWECMNRKSKQYWEGVLCTTKYLNLVNKLGVNKQQLYDKWVFELREIWIY